HDDIPAGIFAVGSWIGHCRLLRPLKNLAQSAFPQRLHQIENHPRAESKFKPLAREDQTVELIWPIGQRHAPTGHVACTEKTASLQVAQRATKRTQGLHWDVICPD